MPELIKVRPTKIELVKLKRRLSLAQRVQKIVKDRLSILTMEFLQTARDTVEAKRKLLDESSMAGKYWNGAVVICGAIRDTEWPRKFF